MRLAGVDGFSVTKLAALAQSPDAPIPHPEDRTRLAAALHLYALSNDCVEKFRSLMFDENLIAIQKSAAAHLGGRDIQRLATRDLPMHSLPEDYRALFSSFSDAYYAPELISESKRQLHAESLLLKLKLGVGSTQIARQVGVAPSNVSAYLANAAVEKVTLKTAQEIYDYLRDLAKKQREERAAALFGRSNGRRIGA